VTVSPTRAHDLKLPFHVAAPHQPLPEQPLDRIREFGSGQVSVFGCEIPKPNRVPCRARDDAIRRSQLHGRSLAGGGWDDDGGLRERSGMTSEGERHSSCLVESHRTPQGASLVASVAHAGQRSEPSSAVDQPGGAPRFTSYSTAFAPHGQLNRTRLHGNGAAVTKYSAICAIFRHHRRRVNARDNTTTGGQLPERLPSDLRTGRAEASRSAARAHYA